jgi:hypothetical protein
VIADIRPDRTVEDKPRSQTAPSPMRLVAHIPILESQSCQVKKQWDASWWRPRQAGWLTPADAGCALSDPAMHAMLLHQVRTGPTLGLDDFVDLFAEGIDHLKSAGNTSRLSPPARDKAIAMALSLANLFTASPGMSHRAAAMTKGLLAHPQSLPCPGLLDWLIVDLDIAGFEEHLHELKGQPDTVEAITLSAGLREAAWRWVAAEEPAA